MLHIGLGSTSKTVQDLPAVGVNAALEPGEWGEWSECSATCGEGLQTSVRDCYEGHPEPVSGCPMPTLRTQKCFQSCPS